MSEFRTRQRSTRTPRAAVSLGLVLLLANVGESATIVPLSGSRSLSVGVINETGGSDGDSASFIGRWDRVVSITRPLSNNGSVLGSIFCLAEQHSNTTATSINDSGRILIDRSGGEGASVTARAQSYFNIRFRIDVETPFSLQVFAPGATPFNGNTFVFLYRGDGTSVGGLSAEIPGPFSGVLQAGDYRIETSIYHFFQPPRAAEADFTYAWSFNIPTPAHAAPLAIIFAFAPRRRR